MLRAWRVIGVALLLVTSVACGAKKVQAPPGGAQADRFLFDRGTEALQKQQWTNARTYFQQVVDGYPQSPVRPDAKLGVGEGHLTLSDEAGLIVAVAVLMRADARAAEAKAENT